MRCKNINYFSLLLFFCLGGTVFSQNNEIDSLQILLKSAKEDTLKVNILNQLAESETERTHHEKASSYANEALVLSNKLSFSKGKIFALYNIGNVNTDVGNYSKALENYFNALRIAEKINYKKFIGALYLSIAQVYGIKQDYDNALLYSNRVLKISNIIEYNIDKSILYSNIAGIYDAKENYEKALFYLNEALKICEQKNDNEVVTLMLLNNIGAIYNKQKKYNKALELYNKILSINERNGDERGMVMHYGNIGLTYILLKKYDEGETYLNKSLSVALKINDLENVMWGYYNLSQVDSMQNEWQSSLKNYKKYVVIHDSLYNALSSKQIAEVQTKYEVEKKDKEVLELKSKEQLAKAEKQKDENKKNFLIAISILSLLLVVALILRQKKQKEANRIKQQLILSELTQSKLEAKNLETILILNQEKLNNYTQQIKDKTELLEKMQQQLENNSQLMLGEKGVEELLNSIQEEINPNEYWEKFITTFNLVHKGFFEELTKKHPNLSRTELRLCAFIKCNLGNKEIANVLNLTHNYVKTACSRLGKKMNLEEEKNLRQFILEIN